MKKLLILMILLGGCVTVAPPTSYTPPSTYTPEPYTPVVRTYVPKVKPLVLHKSLSGISAHIAHDIVKFPLIKRYLKKNPKAWLAIKFDRSTIFSVQKSICYSKYPVKVYDSDDPLVDNDWKKDPKSYQCNLPFLGLRSLIEVELINRGMERIVLGGSATRQILSDERHFQMKHASTRTIHPPGHTAGSSLLMILNVNEPNHPQVYRYASSDGLHHSPSIVEGLDTSAHKTIIQVKVVRVRNNEVMFSKQYLLDAGPYRPVYVNNPPNN